MFTSQMITHCSQQLKVSSFEGIALASFGKKTQRLTSICMIMCNGGFVVSYMVLVRKVFLLFLIVQIFCANYFVKHSGHRVAKVV